MTAPAPLPRLLETAVHRALRAFPVVVVSGARQTGKTTMVRGIKPKGRRKYLNLDEYDCLDMARNHPEALLAEAPFLTLDEVQRAPDLLRAIKIAADDERTPGRFLLTGSANLLLLRTVSESLAGRAIHLTLWPLTRGELLGEARCGRWAELIASPPGEWTAILAEKTPPAADWKETCKRGGYPGPALGPSDVGTRHLWHSGFIRTYLERDLQDVAEVASLVDFRRLMQAAALRIGGLVNQSDLARDVRLSQATVHRHLNLLEATYQLVRVHSYGLNRTKRIIKAPKLYWADTAVALSVAGLDEPTGAHFENLVLCDLLAWRDTLPRQAQVGYWRTTSGHEVDFVLEEGRRVLPVEVKSTRRPRMDDARSLEVFLDEYPDLARGGLVLHGGDDVSWLSKRVLAAPWWMVI